MDRSNPNSNQRPSYGYNPGSVDGISARPLQPQRPTPATSPLKEVSDGEKQYLKLLSYAKAHGLDVNPQDLSHLLADQTGSIPFTESSTLGMATAPGSSKPTHKPTAPSSSPNPPATSTVGSPDVVTPTATHPTLSTPLAAAFGGATFDENKPLDQFQTDADVSSVMNDTEARDSLEAPSQTSFVQPGGASVIPTSSTLYTSQNAFLGHHGRKKVLSLMAGMVTALLLVSGVIVYNVTKKDSTTADSNKTITSIPTDDLLKVTAGNLDSAGTIQINGPLKVSNTFAIAPSTAPDNAVKGQLYYDQNTNTFNYYDGVRFQAFVNSQTISELGGLSKANTGAGLALNGNLLTNTGVTSLQGQTGALSFQAGNGIAINGLQITNTGLTSLQGATGIIVSQSNGIATIALPQDISVLSSPQFAGLSLTAPLAVTSGGTGNTSFTTNGVAYYDGTKLVSSNAGSNIGTQCFVSVAGIPQFVACAGGGGTSVTDITGNTNGLGPEDSLSGNLIFNNASTDNGTSEITIDNATDLAKGIASFNSGNFLVTGGDVAINDDGIALGTKTTGNYVQSVSTGNGLSGSANSEGGSASISLNLEANKGLEADGLGLSLRDCTTNQVLKYNGSNQWVCSTDSAGTGINGTGNDNTIALFTGSGTAIADSIMSQDGLATKVTIAGDLEVTTGDLTVTTGNDLLTGSIKELQPGSGILIDGSNGGITFRIPDGGGMGGYVTFTFPTGGGAIQEICTTGVTCASGGGDAVLLEPANFQDANDGNPTNNNAIWVRRTAGTGALIRLQSSAVDSFVVAASGATTFGSTVTVNGGQITAGTASQLGSLRLADGTSNYLTLQSASLSSDLTFTLPNGAGSAGQCLKTDGNNGAANLTWGSCLSGVGGGNGVTSLNGFGGNVDIVAGDGSIDVDNSVPGVISLTANIAGSNTNLDEAYTNFGTNQALITLEASGARAGIVIQDGSPTPISGSLFTVQGNGGGGTKYLDVTNNGLAVVGSITGSGDVAIGGLDNTLRVDTSTDKVAIGQAVSGTGAKLQLASGGLQFFSGTTAGNDANLTGTIIYDSVAGRFKVYEAGGSLKTLCNSVDGCTITGGINTTLQDAYTNYASTAAVINLQNNGARAGILIRDNASPVTAPLFAVQNNTGATNYLAVTNLGVSVSGNLTATNLQTGNTPTIRIDNSGNLTNISSITASGDVAIGGLDNTLRVDTSTDKVAIGQAVSGTGAKLQLASGGLQFFSGTTAGNDANLTGTIIYDSVAGRFKVYEAGGSLKTLCNSVDGCTITGGINTTLQDAYTNYGNTAAIINLQNNGARAGILIRDNASPVTAPLFAVQNNTGATNYLSVASTGVSVTGDLSTTGGTTISLNGANSAVYTMGSSLTTGTITLGGASQTGNLVLGNSIVSNTVNVGGGTIGNGSVGTINVGTTAGGTGRTAVTIGSLNGASAVTLQSGSGNTNINTGSSTGAVSIGNNTNNTAINVDSGTATINIGTGAQAKTTNIATGAASQIVNIGSATGASPLTLQSGTTGIAASSTTATGNGLALTANSLTTGNGMNISTNSANLTSGNLVNVSQASTYTASNTVSGSSVRVARNTTVNTSQITLDRSGVIFGGGSVDAGSNPNNVIFFNIQTNGACPAAPTYGGVALTTLASYGVPATSFCNYLGYRIGVNGVNTLANVGTPWSIGYSSYYNVSAVSNGQGTGSANCCGAPASPLSLTPITNSAGEKTVDFVAAAGGPGSLAPVGVGETTSWLSTNNNWIHGSGINSTVGSNTMSWGGGGQGFHWFLAGAKMSPVANPLTQSGAVTNISSNCTVTSGACTDSSNVLNLNQQYASATGAVLRLQNSGTGADIQFGTGILRTTADSTTAIRVQNSTGTGNNALIVDTSNKRIGINLAVAPNHTLDVGGNINTSTMYMVGGVQISTASLSDASNIALLNASNTFTGATNTFNTGATTQNGIAVNANSLTSGNAMSINTTSANLTSGNVLSVNQTSTYTATNTVSGSVVSGVRNVGVNVAPGPAIARDTLSSGSGSWNHNVISRSNQILLVYIPNNCGGSCTITYAPNGATNFTNAGNGYYWLANPVANGAGTITVTGGHAGYSYTYYNVDTTNPSVQTTTNSASPNVITFNFYVNFPITTTSGNVIHDEMTISSAHFSQYFTMTGTYNRRVPASGYATSHNGSSYKQTAGGVDVLQWTYEIAAIGVQNTGQKYIELRRYTPPVTLSSPVANFSSNCTVTSGTCTDTSNVMRLQQSYASATGSVLNIQNAGTGSGLSIQNAGGAANALIVNTTSLGGTQTANFNLGAVLKVWQDTGTGRSINATGTINASGADYAEWIPWTGTKPSQGSIVQYHGQDMVVSSETTAGFIGNDKISDLTDAILVTFTGQVPVRVTGSVTAGDYLVANGDGTARAVSPTSATLAEYVSRVATALASGTDTSVLSLVSGPGSSNNFATNPQTTQSFADLNITGTLTTQTLVVTGNATFQGNITINGHLITSGSTPTITSSVPGAVVTIDGTDTAGTITITGITNPNDIATINFSSAFGKVPRIILTGQDDQTLDAGIYPSSKTASGYLLKANQPLAPSSTYTLDYFIIE